jgi:hypothetical protein
MSLKEPDGAQPCIKQLLTGPEVVDWIRMAEGGVYWWLAELATGSPILLANS